MGCTVRSASSALSAVKWSLVCSCSDLPFSSFSSFCQRQGYAVLPSGSGLRRLRQRFQKKFAQRSRLQCWPPLCRSCCLDRLMYQPLGLVFSRNRNLDRYSQRQRVVSEYYRLDTGNLWRAYRLTVERQGLRPDCSGISISHQQSVFVRRFST